MKKNRLAVYTAIYGDTDILLDPPVVPRDCDFYCFTNRKDLRSNVYKIIHIDSKFPGDNNRSAKHFKIFPHEYLDEYEYSVWVDARTYVISENIFSDVKELLINDNLAIFRHPERDSVFEEADICIKWGKDTPENINPQMEKYKTDGFPDRSGLVAGTLIFRRHHAKDVIQFEKGWWEQINTFSKRDQLSFPYVAWKQNFKYKVIDEDIYQNKIIKIISYKDREKIKKVQTPSGRNKIVIYSALFGNIDNYEEYDKKIFGCDFVLITNNKDINLKHTTVRYIDMPDMDFRKAARMFKTLPHRFFPEYEYSVWMDANVNIIHSDIVSIILEVTEQHDIATFKHMHRDYLAEEIYNCILRNKDNSYILMKQKEAYNKGGFTDQVPLIESGVLIRRHMEKEVIKLSEDWWKEIQRFSIRDQISFPYVLWQNPVKQFKLKGYIWKNPYFELQQHNMDSKSFKAKHVHVNRFKEFINYLRWFRTAYSYLDEYDLQK
jgi:hypothetical protein